MRIAVYFGCACARVLHSSTSRTLADKTGQIAMRFAV
jgi:hypothetical protein